MSHEILKHNAGKMSLRELTRSLNTYQKLIDEGKDFHEEFSIIDEEIDRRIIISQFNKFLVETL